MNRPQRLIPILMSLALLTGCSSSPPAGDEVVPIDQVPKAVMDVAHRELPDIEFDTAYKLKVDGKDAYEVRGKNQRGKTREAEVTATGELLEVE